ncbi:MAG: hypothetical protein JNM94_00565 [Phycisphaerae bacterium]|nr:hypothetical protein [Phycisphaerae bacterium]
MKLVASFAALALVACLAGCQNNKTNDAAPGAVSNSTCTKSCDKASCDKAAAAPGAVNGSGCCKGSASSCTKDAANTAAPGAVSGSGCCSKDKTTAAPGAVSGSGCCKSSSSCQK